MKLVLYTSGSQAFNGQVMPFEIKQFAPKKFFFGGGGESGLVFYLLLAQCMFSVKHCSWWSTQQSFNFQLIHTCPMSFCKSSPFLSSDFIGFVVSYPQGVLVLQVGNNWCTEFKHGKTHQNMTILSYDEL